MKKVLVTGASGYIGRHVITELLARGYSVIANDLKSDHIPSGIEFADADIFSGEPQIHHKLGCPDILIHLAWQDGFIHDSAAHMLNLSKHVRFLSDMAEGGCKNISVMGTMHEVGYWVGMIDENTPCNPLSQYGVAKNALRQSMLLLSQEKDFNLYWLRAYYIYGDDKRGNSIFSKIILAEEGGKKTFPFTTGKNKYDFIAVNELAKQIVAASTQEQITGVINVCSGKPISLADRVESFIKENGLHIVLDYGAFPDRAYDSPEVWGDHSKIRLILENEFGLANADPQSAQ
jgi:dTDP-6-deoxy-L-talose 4-dehydrogenase (NAD+)